MGILLSELINRGKGKRILVVTTKSMMAQFQKELWTRFTIPLVRLDSVGLDRVRSRIPTNANPFYYYDKAIISIDTLKQNDEFRVWADKSYWDVIVIDEAHNVAFRGSKLSRRAKLADLLSRRSDTLIMASATPHDGKAASFASLMNMLNPTAIANPEDYGPDDIKGLFLRRYKKDVQEQISGSFLERQVSKHPVPASPKEEAVYDQLAEAKFLSFDGSRRTGQLLFKTVLEKALFSSPAACLETVRQRLRRIEKEVSPEAEMDRATLGGIAESLKQIGRDDFAKYQRLVEMLKPGGYLNWIPADSSDRIVLFTERIETLHFLEENLARDLKLKPGQLEVVHGSGIEDVDLQKIVEDFGRDQSPMRLLLASDIASEGLNLHFLSHKLIHFDIPWSLMVFQQRNGRIDRYGQERQPQIAYLYTEPEHPKIHGDLRILELLVEKDEQAAKNIGDPSVFLGVFDAREEEAMTGNAIEENLAPAEFNRRMEKAAEDDLLTILFGDAPVTLQSLDALRDAARELLTGTDPLLKRLLKLVRDEGKTDKQKAESAKELRELTKSLGKHIRGRISLDPLLQLVKDTGALEGGKPQLADDLSEEDLLYALRLYVETNGVRIPAELNGLGYNNLIYISLVLASLDHQADPTRHGTNASIFPILSIEEPEAHLHPALQYKLLKHIEKRVRETKRNRQVFITTHSTHITSASPLDQLIVFTIPETTGTPSVAYPGRCFTDNDDGKSSKAYVERYLDATKSNLLFSKGVILVE
jgi:hypothetical protein